MRAPADWIIMNINLNVNVKKEVENTEALFSLSCGQARLMILSCRQKALVPTSNQCRSLEQDPVLQETRTYLKIRKGKNFTVPHVCMWQLQPSPSSLIQSHHRFLFCVWFLSRSQEVISGCVHTVWPHSPVKGECPLTWWWRWRWWWERDCSSTQRW